MLTELRRTNMIKDVVDYGYIGVCTILVAVGSQLEKIIKPISAWEEWLPMLQGFAFISAVLLAIAKIIDMRARYKREKKQREENEQS